jgi:hypothetical protein
VSLASSKKINFLDSAVYNLSVSPCHWSGLGVNASGIVTITLLRRSRRRTVCSNGPVAMPNEVREGRWLRSRQNTKAPKTTRCRHGADRRGRTVPTASDCMRGRPKRPCYRSWFLETSGPGCREENNNIDTHNAELGMLVHYVLEWLGGLGRVQ